MKLRDPLELAGYRLGAAAVHRLPVPLTRRLAAGVAARMFERGGKRARWTMTNLRLAFPNRSEEELRSIGRASYVHFAWNFLDFIYSERWTDDDIRARVRFEGLDNVRDALKGGRGAIALSLHLGNFELFPKSTPLFGIPSVALGRPMRNRLLYRRVLEHRTRTGTRILETRNAVRPILRALRDGNLVGILNDQYGGRSKGVYAPFFGYRCLTAAGVATLALRTGVPVVLVYVYREGPDAHVATLDPALDLPRTGNVERDIVEATTIMNREFERVIRAHPEQWLWGHRRFRRSPDLPGNPYE